VSRGLAIKESKFATKENFLVLDLLIRIKSVSCGFRLSDFACEVWLIGRIGAKYVINLM